jgi:hypothetical protein
MTNNISEQYILKIRTALRISHVYLDEEIVDLIEEARADLVLAGLVPEKVYDESDPNIRNAVRTYCKAKSGLDNPDAEKYAESYEAIKRHLQLTNEYKKEGLT